MFGLDRRRRPSPRGLPLGGPPPPRARRDHRVRQHDAPPLPPSDRRCASHRAHRSAASRRPSLPRPNQHPHAPLTTDGCSHDRSVMNSPIGRAARSPVGRALVLEVVGVEVTVVLALGGAVLIALGDLLLLRVALLASPIGLLAAPAAPPAPRLRLPARRRAWRVAGRGLARAVCRRLRWSRPGTDRRRRCRGRRGSGRSRPGARRPRPRAARHP